MGQIDPPLPQKTTFTKPAMLGLRLNLKILLPKFIMISLIFVFWYLRLSWFCHQNSFCTNFGTNVHTFIIYFTFRLYILINVFLKVLACLACFPQDFIDIVILLFRVFCHYIVLIYFCQYIKFLSDILSVHVIFYITFILCQY